MTVVSQMNLLVQEGKGQRGVELGEGEGVVGAPEIQKHREDGVGEEGVEVGGKVPMKKTRIDRMLPTGNFWSMCPLLTQSVQPKRKRRKGVHLEEESLVGLVVL